jgi:hypothetical protein
MKAALLAFLDKLVAINIAVHSTVCSTSIFSLPKQNASSVVPCLQWIMHAVTVLTHAARIFTSICEYIACEYGINKMQQHALNKIIRPDIVLNFDFVNHRRLMLQFSNATQENPQIHGI